MSVCHCIFSGVCSAQSVINGTFHLHINMLNNTWPTLVSGNGTRRHKNFTWDGRKESNHWEMLHFQSAGCSVNKTMPFWFSNCVYNIISCFPDFTLYCFWTHSRDTASNPTVMKNTTWLKFNTWQIQFTDWEMLFLRIYCKIFLCCIWWYWQWRKMKCKM